MCIYLLALSLPGAVPQVLGEGLQGSDRVAVLQRCGHAAVPPTGWNGGLPAAVAAVERVGTCWNGQVEMTKYGISATKDVDLTCVKS